MELTITATQDHQHYVHFRRHLNYSTPFYRWVLESDPSWMLCQSIFLSGSTILKDQNVWWANYFHTTKIWIAGHQMPSCCWCKPFHNNDCLYFSKDHVEEYMKEIAIRLGVFFLFICISLTTRDVFAQTNYLKYWHIALHLFLLLNFFKELDALRAGEKKEQETDFRRHL